MKAVRIVGLLLMGLMAQPAPAASSQVAGRTSPDGKEEIQCDLPGKEHIKNTGGRDGAGLCVFSSLEIAGHWQNVTALRGLQKKMQSEPGGGWPEKVDAMLTKYAPETQYLQYNGADTALLKLALKTGRMPAVTYGYSPRYGAGSPTWSIWCTSAIVGLPFSITIFPARIATNGSPQRSFSAAGK